MRGVRCLHAPTLRSARVQRKRKREATFPLSLESEVLSHANVPPRITFGFLFHNEWAAMELIKEMSPSAMKLEPRQFAAKRELEMVPLDIVVLWAVPKYESNTLRMSEHKIGQNNA